jgi:hypothetical protein
MIKDKLCCCFGRSDKELVRRSRTISTFIKFEDLDDSELKVKYQEAVLEVRKSTEPNDILWKNMKGERGHFICRRMLLFIMGFAILMFVSTPIVIFANFKKADY